MPGDTCIICGNTRAKDASMSMHRFPRVYASLSSRANEEGTLAKVDRSLGLQDDDVRST